MSSTLPLKDRWFEDYAVGEVFEFGDRLITEEEIVEFALRYDPQPFHTDATAAAQSSFGGLVASGWMTAALLMREMCDHFIPPLSALGSPGVDQLRWQRPVRPGDRLRVRVTVLETRRSQSRPERGVVTLLQEVINQSGDVVMSLQGRALQRCCSKS
jgi:acyl dehydratase